MQPGWPKEDPGEFVIRRGKLKGRRLNTLDTAELIHIANLRGKDESAEICRQYAELALRLGDGKVVDTQEAEPPVMQIVPYRPRVWKQPARAYANEEQDADDNDKMSIFDLLAELIGSILLRFKIKLSFSLVGIIKAFLLSYFICMLYPPLARGPGFLCGTTVRVTYDRMIAVAREFYAAFEHEIIVLLKHIWGSVDYMITGSVNEDTFPFGKACIYASIGWLAKYAFSARVLPRVF